MINKIDRLLSVCLHAGIEVRLDKALSTAAAAVKDGRYVILLGQAYQQGDETARATLLAHELGHVLRGDLLHVQAGTVDPAMWNVAADTFINATLPRESVAALGGVLYEGLREQHPSLPEKRPGLTQVLYDLLVAEQDKQGDGDDNDGSGNDAGHGDTLETDGSMTADTHARTVLRARAAARSQGVSLDTEMTLRQPVTAPQPWRPPSKVQRIIEALQIVTRHNRGALVRTRTYARPGRVEGLRGVQRAPRLHVALALDVSGSMQHWLPYMQSAAFAFRRQMDVSLFIWADALAPYRGEIIADVGCGTNPACLQALANKCDAAVVITDGYFEIERATAAHNALPCVWLIVKGGRTDNLPPSAHVVVEDEI